VFKVFYSSILLSVYVWLSFSKSHWCLSRGNKSQMMRVIFFSVWNTEMRVESFRRRLYKTSYLQGHTRIFSCFFKKIIYKGFCPQFRPTPFFVSLVFISHRKSSQERLFWWALLMCSQACLYKLTKIHDLSV